ncbi:MAG: 3-methyl-2-oxobutanoate dehydrogenase subunit VorB [Anaerolineae bacterium]
MQAEKELLKGNVAIAEAALRAGMTAYFGYPITPQTELLEHLAHRMPELGRTFLQAESEIAAINMVYGAACAGVRVMTSSSGPGISLMQEGMSYIAGSELPCVVIDVMRGGPGLGNILPSQSDYFQVTRSAGHGDYHPIVLAPSSVQEAVDLTVLSFDLAEQYRHLVILAADGMIGQMMEPATLPPMRDLPQTRPDYALTGAKNRAPRRIASFYLQAEAEEAFNLKIQARLAQIRAAEQRSVEYFTQDAQVLIVGYGSAGRIALSAVQNLRQRGLPVGLFRPLSLWPYPEDRLRHLADQVRLILVVEMNAGQMLDDVRLSVAERVPVHFYGRMGGAIPVPDEIEHVLLNLMAEVAR